MVEDSYSPEKWVWTDSDFEKMGFHDCKIHGWGLVYEIESPDFAREFIVDLDYVLQWICPAPTAQDRGVWFWVAPVTLVFEEVDNIDFDFGLKGMLSLEINRFYSEPLPTPLMSEAKNWILDCFGGSIEIVASGFKMYIRSKPILQQAQRLTLKQRGGLSFDRVRSEEQ